MVVTEKPQAGSTGIGSLCISIDRRRAARWSKWRCSPCPSYTSTVCFYSLGFQLPKIISTTRTISPAHFLFLPPKFEHTLNNKSPFRSQFLNIAELLGSVLLRLMGNSNQFSQICALHFSSLLQKIRHLETSQLYFHLISTIFPPRFFQEISKNPIFPPYFFTRFL